MPETPAEIGGAAASNGTINTAYSSDGRVATIVVDRASKLNALTLPMVDALHEACIAVAQSAARVVLVRTAGDRVFSVGADINRFADLAPLSMWRTWISTGHAAFAALENIPQPTVAVVDGLAFGGGLELALAADFRVFSTEARISLPETGLGTVPGWGGTERLTALIGAHRTKEMVLTRRVLDAAQSFEWGVATRLSDAGALEATVSSFVSELLGASPVAQQLAKQIISAAADGAPSSVLEALAGGVAAATDDLTEGITAFREKRDPHFNNR